MEFKELKCKNCGAKLQVIKDEEKVKCNHCGSEYLIDHGKNNEIHIHAEKFNTPNSLSNPSLRVLPILCISIGVFIIIAMATFFIITNSFIGDTSKHYTDFEISSFNNQFKMYSGTTTKFFIEPLIDTVVLSNKEKDKQVTVTFEDKTYEEEKELIELKHSLKEKVKYEVSLDFDGDGFVVNIDIVELKK